MAVLLQIDALSWVVSGIPSVIPLSLDRLVLGSGHRRTCMLESLHDGFRELLGHRDGTHVDNDVIDPAILVEVHLIDRLKLLALDLALEAKKAPIVPCISHQLHLIPGAVLAT
jgi:hypothetical protein